MAYRRVEVAPEQAREAEDNLGLEYFARLTGTDTSSGETVRFRMNKVAFSEFLLGAHLRASTDVIVRPEHIISVERVPAEWDSPGTSPEDGS